MTIVVLLVLFLIKSKTIFNNNTNESAGIYSGDMKLSELVNTDTDLDGVMNWEEGLWGTNPTLKDTDSDGEEDGVEITKLKLEKGGSEETNKSEEGENKEFLTETDKFSRELFSTIVALNQAGEVDEASADKLTESLANEIKNSVQKKVFLISEIKTTPDNSATSAEKYITQIADINKKYPINISAIDVLKEFVNDGENVNTEALSKLDIIIKQKSLVINDFSKMIIPSELAQLHLDMTNALQVLTENLGDIQLFEIDPIVAMGAISSYDKNLEKLDSALEKLGNAVRKKLNNQ